MSRAVSALTQYCDKDAIEIGELYRNARSSMVDSVRYLIEAGHRLIAKKVELGHGKWLPWLEENAEVLGFESRFTAAKLMNAAAKCAVNGTFAHDEALQISRQIWGNDNVRGTQGTGEEEWYTPAQYIALARERVVGANAGNNRGRSERHFDRHKAVRSIRAEAAARPIMPSSFGAAGWQP
jgi:hypothetical protein